MGSRQAWDGTRFNLGRDRIRRAYGLFLLAVLVAAPLVVWISNRYWPPMILVFMAVCLVFLVALMLLSQMHGRRRYGYWIPVVDGELWPTVAIFGGVMIFLPLLLSEEALLDNVPVLDFLSKFTLPLILIEAVGAMAIFTILAARKARRLAPEEVQYRFTKANLESVKTVLRATFKTLGMSVSEIAGGGTIGPTSFVLTDGECRVKVGAGRVWGAVIIRERPKGMESFYSPEADEAIDLALSRLDASTRSHCRGTTP